MTVPPDIQHAMDVAKNQSTVSQLHNCVKIRLDWFCFGTILSCIVSLILFCLLSCPTPQVSYKKNAKANLHYTTVADRPDIKKATQAAKLISHVIKQHMHETQFKPQSSINGFRLKYKCPHYTH